MIQAWNERWNHEKRLVKCFSLFDLDFLHLPSFHGYFVVQNELRCKFLQTFDLPVFAMSEELISHISFLSIIVFFHENFGVTIPIHEHVRFNNFFSSSDYILLF